MRRTDGNRIPHPRAKTTTVIATRRPGRRFFLQSQEGDKAEERLRKGALSIMPDHGDALADLAVAMALQGAEDPDKMAQAMDTLERAEKNGASGSSYEKRRCVGARVFFFFCGVCRVFVGRA